MRPYWPLAVGSIVLTGLLTVLGLLSPWPLQILVDHVLQDRPLPGILAAVLKPLEGHQIGLLIFAVVAGMALTLLVNGLTVLQNFLETRLELRMVLDFRSAMFQHTQRLSLSFHDRRRTGSMMNVVNSQASAIGSIALSLPPLAQSVLTVLGMTWITFWISPQLALLSLVAVPVIYYLSVFYMSHIEPRLQQVRAMEGQSLIIVHEAMSMLRVIVAFGREDYEYRRFRRHGETAVNARVGLTVRQTMFSLGVGQATAMGTALVLGVGAYQVIGGQLSVGQLLVVMAYVASVYSPLQAISSTLGALQERRVALEAAFDLMDMEPEVEDTPGAITVHRAAGQVEFEGVHFAYTRHRSALQDVSFKLEAGQATAIVGPTGAGKSTLVSLIPRFFDPTKGRVLLDGTDIRYVTLKSLREQISLVLQEPLLFATSIADNIRYGRLDATEAEIIEAAKAANAHEFIMELPKRYETELGERGSQISGGERQRIALARAFLKNTPILILDEPTLSVDSKTEAVILEALDRLTAGRTTFMIAHRLSTIRNAHVTLVLDHGRLVEVGTHQDLLARGGLYKQMYEKQTAQADREIKPSLRPDALAAERG